MDLDHKSKMKSKISGSSQFRNISFGKDQNYLIDALADDESNDSDGSDDDSKQKNIKKAVQIISMSEKMFEKEDERI